MTRLNSPRGADRRGRAYGGSFGLALLAVILDGALAHAAANVNSPATAFDQTFWWAIGFTGVAMLISLALPGRPRAAVSEPVSAATVPPAPG